MLLPAVTENIASTCFNAVN